MLDDLSFAPGQAIFFIVAVCNARQASESVKRMQVAGFAISAERNIIL
jgi:hypothetical protein